MPAPPSTLSWPRPPLIVSLPPLVAIMLLVLVVNVMVSPLLPVLRLIKSSIFVTNVPFETLIVPPRLLIVNAVVAALKLAL